MSYRHEILHTCVSPPKKTNLPQEPISSAYLDFPPFWIYWKTPKNDMEMLKRCQKWILQVKISQFTCIICFKWTISKMTIFQYGRHPPSWISPNKHIFFDHTRRFWVIGVMYYPKTPKLFGWKKFPRFPKNQGSATGLKKPVKNTNNYENS